jgi:hypothetical protein
LFSWNIDPEIFAEGFRDKIFDTEIVAALGRVLGDTHPGARSTVVDFFTVAMAQGTLHFFYGIFMLKYSQRAFRTRYLILRPSPYLDVR